METHETDMPHAASYQTPEKIGLIASPDRLIGRDEVDEIFGIPKRFLEIVACKGGGPPFVKIGRLTKYRVRDVLSWIESHRFENTSQVQRAAELEKSQVAHGVGRGRCND